MTRLAHHAADQLMAKGEALVMGGSVASQLFLALFGGIAARVGGESVMEATLRVTFLGAAAMALMDGNGPPFGTEVR